MDFGSNREVIQGQLCLRLETNWEPLKTIPKGAGCHEKAGLPVSADVQLCLDGQMPGRQCALRECPIDLPLAKPQCLHPVLAFLLLWLEVKLRLSERLG